MSIKPCVSVLAALSFVACAETPEGRTTNDPPITATTESTGPAFEYAPIAAETLPIVLERPGDGTVPTPAELFGWTPDFPVNVVGFDSMDRAYIRERTIDEDDIPGTMKRLRGGTWEMSRFEDYIAAWLPGTGVICYRDGGGEYGAQIVFDRDDRAYTIVQVTRAPTKAQCPNAASRGDDPDAYPHLLLLDSGDYGDTWRVTALPYASEWMYEHAYSPEPLEGPPAILLYNYEGAYKNRGPECGGESDPPCEAGRACIHGKCLVESEPVFCHETTFGRLEIVKPYFDELGLQLARTAVPITTVGMAIRSHSGGGNQILTRNGRIYVVWGEAEYITEQNGVCADPGHAVSVAAYSRVGNGVYLEERAYNLTRSYPTNDAHNRGALVMDSTNRLHLVLGAHENYLFTYVRFLLPDTIIDWATPEPTVPGTLGTNNQIGQTYAGLLVDDDDRLHLIYRRSNGYVLEYQTRPAGGPWTTPRQLVQPPRDFSDTCDGLSDPTPNSGVVYAVYYHQPSIDHQGRLYLTFSYYSTRCPFTRWFEDGVDVTSWPIWFDAKESFEYSAMLMSTDGGATWGYASTRQMRGDARMSVSGFASPGAITIACGAAAATAPTTMPGTIIGVACTDPAAVVSVCDLRNTPPTREIWGYTLEYANGTVVSLPVPATRDYAEASAPPGPLPVRYDCRIGPAWERGAVRVIFSSVL